ncbi:endonuclease/exonuclease/phosphatase family protein [Shewanella sp. A25]|nr:endonuclease/exonuclease/phosphatase family protein [Shewanella shenzhenensis]
MLINSDENAASKAVHFTLATINLFNFIEPPLAYYDFENIYTQSQWQRKCQWFSDFLSHHIPDIVGFQEVFSPDALQTLALENGLPHFAVIDKPTLISDYIYKSPVVALASRFPIVEIASVEPDAQLVAAMGLSSNFSFSRKVLRATVALPQIGECDCYVVHFKSKRPGLALDATEIETLKRTETGLDAEPLLLTEQALGRWASTMQRGAEAALLFHAILKRRQTDSKPMILMGDFNDTLSMGALDALTMRGETIHGNDIKAAGLGALSDAALGKRFRHYQLSDAFELFIEANLFVEENHADNTDYYRQRRSATHYYGPKGSVLDYILLSNEFDARDGASLAQVIDYQTCDRHLVRPEFERDAYSTDHAPIVVELAMRS